MIFPGLAFATLEAMGTMMRSDPWSNPQWLLTGKVPQTAANQPRTLDSGSPPLLTHAPTVGAAASLTLGILGLLRLGPEFLRHRPLTCVALCITGIALIARRTSA